MIGYQNWNLFSKVRNTQSKKIAYVIALLIFWTT